MQWQVHLLPIVIGLLAATWRRFSTTEMAAASKKAKATEDGVREIELPGDDGFVCQAVELVKGASRALVHLHGATLTSWTYQGEELIFLSDKAVHNGKKALRGGIPLVFPKFGAWEHGPNHGFARISQWQLAASSRADMDAVNAEFELVANDQTKAMWDFDFKLRYVVSLSEDELSTTFVIKNTGDKAFSFETLLHTYFRVPDIRKFKLHGLGGVSYRDQLQSLKEIREERDVITIDENVDRIYMACLATHTLTGVGADRPASKEDHSSVKPRTRITMTKAGLPDSVVWNPWIEKAKAMGDLPDDAYHHFVCVEAGQVSSALSLEPQQTWQGGQVLKVEKYR
eukprot:TRINITY_DN9460_c0_g1_i1.p1 TRINITY_DN9460_c0_g1~~TRINITY_DN9460_c0_g1_i1.p1  ORF type:complete len:342 (+),score=62.48 TRINITY_DN9460_c0_g1_i1:3-1028(+)